jgi:hypothetical protein
MVKKYLTLILCFRAADWLFSHVEDLDSAVAMVAL